MPKIGIVYFEDDPYKRVFRTVYPYKGESDKVFKQSKWTTLGVPKGRKAILEIVDSTSPEIRPTGTPWTSATEVFVAPISLAAEDISSPALIDKALKIAGITSKDVFCDLGTGDGSVLLEVAKLGATIVGYESNVNNYNRTLTKLQGFDTSRIFNKNFLGEDLTGVTVVYANLNTDPSAQVRLAPNTKTIFIINGELKLGLT